MKNTLQNTSLKSDLKEILKNLNNIKEIRKGTIGGYSIEIEYIEPHAESSFLYLEKGKRDTDYKELKKAVKSCVKTNI